MTEIKKCPFCGCKGKLAEKSKTYYNGEQVHNTYVYCSNCDARGRRAILSHFPTHKEAHEYVIESWNKRAGYEAEVTAAVKEAEQRLYSDIIYAITEMSKIERGEQ